MHRVGQIGFDDLAEPVDDAIAPSLDRSNCDETGLDADQKFWRDNGYVLKCGSIPTRSSIATPRSGNATLP